MSTQQHQEAELPGYGNPRFFTALNESIEPTNLNRLLLAEICASIAGFTQLSDRVATTDGYGWYAGLNFERSGTEIVLLIPWSQDWAKLDGSQTDRSAAVYVKGEINKIDLDELVQEIATAINLHMSTLPAPRHVEAD